MERFMLLLHESQTAFAEITPEEVGSVIARYQAWSESLARNGRLEGGEKLTDGEGRVVRRGAGGKAQVVDGPYAEAKEVIGGYFVIKAESYEEAAEMASTCPHLDFGWVEIRQIDNIAN